MNAADGDRQIPLAKRRHDRTATILYLLRRRRYDDAYLNPSSDLANTVKNELGAMLEQIGQQGGGAIPLESVLELVIDYIDRKGPDILREGVRDALQLE